MRTTEQIADTVEDALRALLAGDRAGLVAHMDTLLRGPKWDAYRAVVLIAGGVCADWKLEDGQEFYRLRVRVVDPDGVHQGGAKDMPPTHRVFAQITVAVANRDEGMARALFRAHCGEHSSRAAGLLTVGLSHLAELAAREVGGQ